MAVVAALDYREPTPRWPGIGLPRGTSRNTNPRPQRLLQAVSRPAIAKRPSVTNWIGKDLAPIACGVLRDMLDDHALQRGIANREVACVIATTRSVLQTPEHPRIDTFRTVITYFSHDGTLFSDAISQRVPRTSRLGYQVVAMDDVTNGQ